MDLSLSSKHLLFLSFQRHHNKQWGTINHINLMTTKSALPTCQKPHYRLRHNPAHSKQTKHHRPQIHNNQTMKKEMGQLIHHYTCTCSTNPIFKPSFFVNFQSLSISLTQQSKQRKLLTKESSASKYLSKENNSHQSPLKYYNNF